MIIFTIQSKIFNKEFVFSIPENGGYIRLGDNTLAPQMVLAGGHCASADSSEVLCRVSRAWYQRRVRSHRGGELAYYQGAK